MAGTFSSRALWCSKSNFSALSTSTSLVMPAGDCACRLRAVQSLSCVRLFATPWTVPVPVRSGADHVPKQPPTPAQGGQPCPATF